MTQKNAKQKSREYFNSHRKSRLAHRGYWRHDCRISEYGSERDPVWEQKYIDITYAR